MRTSCWSTSPTASSSASPSSTSCSVGSPADARGPPVRRRGQARCALRPGDHPRDRPRRRSVDDRRRHVRRGRPRRRARRATCTRSDSGAGRGRPRVLHRSPGRSPLRDVLAEFDGGRVVVGRHVDAVQVPAGAERDARCSCTTCSTRGASCDRSTDRPRHAVRRADPAVAGGVAPRSWRRSTSAGSSGFPRPGGRGARPRAARRPAERRHRAALRPLPRRARAPGSRSRRRRGHDRGRLDPGRPARRCETRFPGVYAVGDVTSVGTPKAGVFAEGQAAVVAERDHGASARRWTDAGLRRARHLLPGVRTRPDRHGRRVLPAWRVTSRRPHRSLHGAHVREVALRLLAGGALVRTRVGPGRSSRLRLSCRVVRPVGGQPDVASRATVGRPTSWRPPRSTTPSSRAPCPDTRPGGPVSHSGFPLAALARLIGPATSDWGKDGRRAVMTVRRLSALDAGFLALETDGAPLHVGALMLLDGPAPDHDLLRADLARRASTVAACRQLVRPGRCGLRRPIWVDDPDVVAEGQMHAASVEPPGDRGALCRLVVELMSVRLDTSHPLWEVWRIDGLADGSWAMLVKAHHSLIDGVSGAGLLSALLSPADVPRDGAEREPVATPGPGLRERVRRLRQGLRTVAVPDLPPSVLNGALGQDPDLGLVHCRPVRPARGGGPLRLLDQRRLPRGPVGRPAHGARRPCAAR